MRVSSNYRVISKIPILVSIIILIIFSSCSERPWKDLSIGDSRIKVKFPWTPKIRTKTVNIRIIGAANITTYSLNMDDALYSVSVTKVKDEEHIYNKDDLNVRSQIRSGAKLRRTKSLFVDDVSGKEFVLKKRNSNRRQYKIKIRMFVDSNYLYTVSVVYRRINRFKARKFLKSIRFTAVMNK